jgi:hypothetical protein
VEQLRQIFKIEDFDMKYPVRLILSFLLVAIALASTAFAGGTISGKVSSQEKGLADATVSLYAVGGERITGPADYEVAKTAADGTFEIVIKPGPYFLVVKKYKDPTNPGAAGDIFSYYGGNPVVVEEGKTINIGVNAAPIQPLAEKHKKGGTGIRGKIFADGKPLGRTRVTLYQDTTTIFRGIGYASTITSEQGDFSFTLEPGDYYVIARKRVGEEKMGPLSKGDFFGFAHDNPVKVEDGQYSLVSVNASTKFDKVKQGGQDITLGGTVQAGGTTITGVIRDKAGKPVAKVYAAAYRDSMMTMKPDFISSPTGPDGIYTIALSEGGEYYVGARNTIGGPAERGDLLGRYAGNEDHVVKIATDEKLSGIDVVVEPVE